MMIGKPLEAALKEEICIDIVVLNFHLQSEVFVGPDRFVVRDVFPASLSGGSITIKMGKSTRSRLDVSASLGLLQYWCVCSFFSSLILKKV